jgi:hypothetical protein
METGVFWHSPLNTDSSCGIAMMMGLNRSIIARRPFRVM